VRDDDQDAALRNLVEQESEHDAANSMIPGAGRERIPHSRIPARVAASDRPPSPW